MQDGVKVCFAMEIGHSSVEQNPLFYASEKCYSSGHKTLICLRRGQRGE